MEGTPLFCFRKFNCIPCAVRFAVVDSYSPTIAVNHPFVLALKAVKSAGTYEFHITLQMTVAARIVALRNQVIPCADVVHLIAFLHLLYTAA